MLVNAMRICEAEFGHLLLYDGECFRAAYLHNLPPAYRKFWEQGPVRVSTKLALGRLPQTKEVVQITNMKADRAYGEGDPLRVATVDLGGAQTLLCVFVYLLLPELFCGFCARRCEPFDAEGPKGRVQNTFENQVCHCVSRHRREQNASCDGGQSRK